MINIRNPTVSSSTTVDATLASEVIRNVNVILGTLEGEVACDRSFGLNPNFLDKPLDLAKQLYIITVIDKVEQYEPRAAVENIVFDSDALKGSLNPRVVITIES